MAGLVDVAAEERWVNPRQFEGLPVDGKGEIVENLGVGSQQGC